jgi:hypothetical protein
MRPALTPEAQENQMIALAMNLVEQRLRNGTASSQETTHFLKLATVKSQLEKEKLMAENRLLEAKANAIDDAKESKELYDKALRAMRNYSGNGDPDEYQDVY